MMKNPLKRPIIEILRNAESSIKEYELHEILGGKAFEQFVVECSDDLRLFRQHFMVMNALYDLHYELLPKNIFLHISALDIRLSSVDTESHTGNNTKNQKDIDKVLLPESKANEAYKNLSEYYLDWDNFNKTNEQDVDKLLKDFWKNYLNYNEKDKSLACLNLTNGSGWNEVKQTYRQLCQKYHPDKGGDTLYFIQIRQAYDNLKQVYTGDL